MSTYTFDTDTFRWTEAHIYGSSRIGVYLANKDLVIGGTAQTSTLANNERVNTRGKRNYELANHLGNVLVVISDKRQGVCTQSGLTNYQAEIVSATDYYAFGSAMPGREYTMTEYRYGFNGMERDKKISEDNYDFGARIYDGRLGRWLSLDPLFFKFDGYSPYNFTLANSIAYKDYDGEDVWVSISSTTKDYSGHAQIIVTNYKLVYVTVEGKLVERYVKDGYTVYEITPEKTLPDGTKVGGNKATKYTGEYNANSTSSEGVFNVNITPTPQKIGNSKVEYFTKDQIQKDLNVSKKAQTMVNSNKSYSVKSNNCVDFVTNALSVLNTKYKNFGQENISITIFGLTFSGNISTPNQLAKKLNNDKDSKVIKFDKIKFDFKTIDYIKNLSFDDIKRYLNGT